MIAGKGIRSTATRIAQQSHHAGNRPGFSAAAAPDLGRALYEQFLLSLTRQGLTVERGQFGADMKVALVNEGPVTIWLES